MGGVIYLKSTASHVIRGEGEPAPISLSALTMQV